METGIDGDYSELASWVHHSVSDGGTWYYKDRLLSGQTASCTTWTTLGTELYTLKDNFYKPYQPIFTVGEGVRLYSLKSFLKGKVSANHTPWFQMRLSSLQCETCEVWKANHFFFFFFFHADSRRYYTARGWRALHIKVFACERVSGNWNLSIGIKQKKWPFVPSDETKFKELAGVKVTCQRFYLCQTAQDTFIRRLQRPRWNLSLPKIKYTIYLRIHLL